MKVLSGAIGSSGEFELTADEKAAHNYWSDQLDRGLSIPDTVAKTRLIWAALDPKFYEWIGK